MSTIAREQRIAAWPTLLGVQGLVVLSLGLLGWQAQDTEDVQPAPVQSRLEALDLSAASAAVETR